VVVLGGGVASFLRTVCLNRAQDSIAARLRSQLFGALLTQRDLEFYQSSSLGSAGSSGDDPNPVEEDGDDDKNQGAKAGDGKGKKMNGASPADATTVATSPGAIGSVLADDIGKVSEILTTTLANTIRSACSVSFATLNMIRINPSLLGLSISVVPLIGSAAVVLNKFVKKVSAKQSEVKAQASSFAEERISHIATVKTSCREADEVDRYDQLQLDAARLGRAVSLAKGTFMGFMFAASSGALFLVFQTGGKAVLAGRMTSGQLTSFATYTFLLGLGTSGIMKASSEMAQGIVCAGRMYGLMDGKEMSGNDAESQGVSGTENVDPTVVNSISLDGVSFAYRSNPSKNVLKGMSLKIERGKVIALLGQNGSGKSTTASLLSALYRPQSGRITTSNGTDLYSLSRRAQSHLVQSVPQHPAFFDMSVLDNVTYTNPNATEEEVEEALTTANCDGFLSKLESGTSYRVGRNGSKLSGGQRQRLALARALLSDPCCLVLDEPTSSLDAEGESAVADAVRACRKQRRGLLLITHRAKTLELCDEVVVLKDGEIIERGDYQNLKSKKDSALCTLMPDLL
jgi:ABC-type multidrug transport system fused ATPase/permease subunit